MTHHARALALQVTVPLYVGTEDVVGSVSLSSYKNKPVDLEHAGIKVELIGESACGPRL